MEQDLAALAEKFFGVNGSATHLALVYANGDVIVYEAGKRPGSWGAALAGFRWDGARLRLALGRMPDPKVQRAVETWVGRTVQRVPDSAPARFERSGA